MDQDKHTFKGKRWLCSTDLSDFTDFQGIGHDPLYRRYDSVASVIRQVIPAQYADFLAQPNYIQAKDEINWYIPEWKETPQILTSLTGADYEKYIRIKQETMDIYKSSLNQLSGEDLRVMASAIKGINDNFIFCCANKVYAVAWGMSVDPGKYNALGTLIMGAPKIPVFTAYFKAGEHGKIGGSNEVKAVYKHGQTIENDNIPRVIPEEGYEFLGWSPDPSGKIMLEDAVFEAKYKELPKTPVPPVVPPGNTPPPPGTTPPPVPPEGPVMHTCSFAVGEHGILKGAGSITKPDGSFLLPAEFPYVKPKRGYNFQGWSPNPTQTPVKGDMVFTAQYEKRLPWYKRWFGNMGWWKWLLLALLLLLLFLILFSLLRGCSSCHRNAYREVNGVVPVEDRIIKDGDTVRQAGVVKPIRLTDGKLPEGAGIVAPIREEDGAMPPIIRNPGVPPVIGNRLILFLEDDNADLDAFADAFKKEFPGEEYQIIGFDRDVKSLVITVPENQRDTLRDTLNQRLPGFNFIVFDEEIYELNGMSSTTQECTPGWHLAAVRAPQGWEITKGSPDVKVAVVDDGIDPSHPMFENRIIDAYNVYTQSNRLSAGEGHGTHTAALAVGSLSMYDKGAAGIAPNCKLIPVQVSDDGTVTLSALISGIMYSVHKGADVVNVSIGPNFQGLNALPVEAQEEIAATRFKNVEKLWNRVCSIASKKNCILVFAAGNDDIISAIPPENRVGNAIAVGAVDHNLYPTVFTNYGPCTDISAPGQEILSAFPGGQLQSFDGTSMAAPIVSGTIALMKSLKKDLTVQQALNVLFRTGCDVYGYMPPMVQVDLALQAVKKGDFSAPGPRELKPVPADAIDRYPDRYHTTPPASWTDPLPSDRIFIPGTPVKGPVAAVPGQPGNGIRNPSPGSGLLPDPAIDDAQEIRKLIEEYKRKIAELEKQLPENQKR